MPFWQKSRPACHFGKSGTPSKEEACKARTKHYPTQKGTANIAGPFCVEVANLTVRRLCSNKIITTLERRIVATIAASTIESSNPIVRKLTHIDHFCHVSFSITRNRLNIFKVINTTNPSIIKSIINATINMKRNKTYHSHQNKTNHTNRQKSSIHNNLSLLCSCEPINQAYHTIVSCQA